MQILKTYEYIFSEDEIRQMIVDYFNKTYTEHLPVTKANVRIEVERGRYQECDPIIHAIIEIEEEGKNNDS